MNPLSFQYETWIRKDYICAAGLVILALIVRLPNLLCLYVINPDAMDYVGSAKAISQGRWAEGFGMSHTSLYPVLIATFEPLMGGWVHTARGITVFFGILSVVPLYLVACRVLHWPWRLIPPIFYCLSPSLTHYSMDIVREPFSWFAVFMAIWAVMRGLDSGRRAWLLIGGTFFLLAIVNRFDGVVALGAVGVWIVWRGIHKGRLAWAVKEAAFVSVPSLLAGSIGLVLLFCILGHKRLGDFVTYKRQLGVAFKLTGKSHHETVKAILENIPQAYLRNLFSSAWENRYGLASLELTRHWVRAAHPLLLGLGLLGILKVARGRKEDPWWILLLMMGAYLLVGYIRVSGAFAISRRHLGIAVISGYYFGALGLAWVHQVVTKWRGWFFEKAPLLLAFVLLGSTVPWTLSSQRSDKVVRRLAGEWIRAQGVIHPVIATQHHIVAFYAEGKWLPLDELIKGSSCAAQFLVVEESYEELALAAVKRCGGRGYLEKEIIYEDNPKLRIYTVKSAGGW